MKIMQECLKLETERLAKSWLRHDRGTLRDYLVQDVEDPRINVQSILTRHFLIEQLFGDRFDDLMEHELRFALAVNWLLGLLKKSIRVGQLHAVLDALLAGEDEAEGLKIPLYVSETFVSLFLPNYMCDLFSWAPVETTEVPIPEYLMSTFQKIWHEVLDNEQPQNVSFLEPACGSANDYRFIEAFGIARLLNYTGFDLCEKNICNARQMFPDACFKVGNVLEIEAADDEFDYCFVQDLFEHLSVEAMETAIAEICRVTRKTVCAGFFNIYDGGRHKVRIVGDYHWNKLSALKTRVVFERYASVVQVVHIDTFLRSKFHCEDTHNKGAYTLIISI
ncbi:MAG: class I SAM-dependent methyltransferase [Sedimentisphaerales bacterium]|nr:class I SAM-dependent methyltransferase [Sedimentisphaerales bacterium]